MPQLRGRGRGEGEKGGGSSVIKVQNLRYLRKLDELVTEPLVRFFGLFLPPEFHFFRARRRTECG